MTVSSCWFHLCVISACSRFHTMTVPSTCTDMMRRVVCRNMCMHARGVRMAVLDKQCKTEDRHICRPRQYAATSISLLVLTAWQWTLTSLDASLLSSKDHATATTGERCPCSVVTATGAASESAQNDTTYELRQEQR
jgi:hypothetical protein